MADTPPLLVGGYTKSKLVPFRFEKEADATDASFIARGQFFEMLDIARRARLERPSLVSSLHGGIEKILFTIPGWVFFPEEARDENEAELIRKYAAVFRALLATVPEEAGVVVLLNDVARERLEQWIVEFGLGGRCEVVSAPDGMRYTVWAEDAYSICDDLADDETYFVEPASFNRGDDAYIADRIARETPFESTQVQLYFQGGNILIGDDFWFIGADYPANSLRLGFITVEAGETTEQAVKRGYGSLMDGGRTLIPIGSRVPVRSQVERPIMLNGERWTEVLYFGNHRGTVQPLFHIDMFITLAGRDGEGKYRVLVGSPAVAAELLNEPLPEGAMQPVFDDIARGLEELGFRVIRNPLPTAYDDDDEEKKRYWYFATGNNVILQDDPKTVWLPTYGHDAWGKLSVTDDANAELWAGLGYEVRRLPNFHPFAANLGAAHCIKKYLGRR